MTKNRTRGRLLFRVSWAVALLLGSAAAASAFILDLTLVEALHDALAEHTDQSELTDLVVAGEHEEAFDLAFERGDELFEVQFNALDGGGANVGDGQRYTRVPRADLTGANQWANHFPERATGPNAAACNHCHNVPFDDGAGFTSGNVHRDPLHSASLGKFIQRNTPHVFAPGAVQRLAEEMTDDLQEIRGSAISTACASGGTVVRSLSAKGVGYGTLKVTRTGVAPCRVNVDTTQVSGVDADLVIKPFQWKGFVASLRDFNRGASHNELGMQAVEIVGAGADGDFDGVTDELTIGDQTALAIYLAAQPRPTTLLELNSLGLIPPLTAAQIGAINRGATSFTSIGCAGCHKTSLKIDHPIFSEPSQHENYRDKTFPAGQDPLDEGVDPDLAVTFDLTADQPDNVITLPDGTVVRLGSLEKDSAGRGIVRLFSDLKRHNMGTGLAERIDEVGTGAAVFLTEALWGVGSTGPWMHDGRSTTLTEAILEHGGEGAASRTAFQGLTLAKQKDVIAFLDSLVLFKVPEPE